MIEIFFLQFWRLWSPQPRWTNWFLVRTLFLACRWLSSWCIFKRSEKALWILFKGHWSYDEDPTLITVSNSNFFPQIPTTNPIILEIRASTYEFWRRLKHLLHNNSLMQNSIILILKRQYTTSYPTTSSLELHFQESWICL